MAPEDVKKLLIVVSAFLVVFLVFFFFFWRPKSSELGRLQEELSEKQAELARLERDAADWPDTITRERLMRYEEELAQLWELIPSQEEVSALLRDVQDHARAADLEILSLTRTATVSRSRPGQEVASRYARVPYKIIVGGNYFGLVRFLRRLEDSKRLVTVTSTKVYTVPEGFFIGAEVEFNIFYSRTGVETG